MESLLVKRLLANWRMHEYPLHPPLFGLAGPVALFRFVLATLFLSPSYLAFYKKIAPVINLTGTNVFIRGTTQFRAEPATLFISFSSISNQF